MKIQKSFWLLPLLFLLSACSREKKEVTSAPVELKEDDFVAYSGVMAPSASDYFKMEEAKMVRSFASGDEKLFSHLPAQVDLSIGLPEPGNQGNQNSCTGWALSFAVRSFQENRELGWGLKKEHLFSPSFVYNQINGGKDGGADLKDALDFLLENGTVPWPLMPYDEKEATLQPAENLKDLARGFRVLGYRRIGESEINQIKSYLASGEPVLVVLEMFQNFLKKGMREAGNIYAEKKGDLLGHHALVAVGYDDSKKAFKLLNSWGTRWGDNGYGWVDYDFAKKIFKQTFVLYDTPTSPKVVDDFVRLAALPQEERIVVGAVRERPVEGREDPLKSGTGFTDDQILIVPDEAGITYEGLWVRLGDEMAQAKNIPSGSAQIQDDLLSQNKVSKMHFYRSSSPVIATNRGVTFGADRKEVTRIYGPPDFIDPATEDEVYFFHAISEDWGGVNLTKHASLSFHYDHDGGLSFMGLESVFKKVKMGQGLEQLEATEKSVSAEGTMIKSPDGRLQFLVPSFFDDIQKSVWFGAGYGFFMKNSKKPEEFLVVKVFQVANPVNESMLNERISADLQTAQLNSLTPKTVEINGRKWKKVEESDHACRYYTYEKDFFVQVQLASSTKIAETNWVKTLFDSLRF